MERGGVGGLYSKLINLWLWSEKHMYAWLFGCASCGVWEIGRAHV